MRPLLKFGVPLAGGLATGGYALSQGEDPGSAALAGLAGGVGAAGGLLAARQLAGKYAPDLRQAAQAHLTGTRENPKGIGAVLSAARKAIPSNRSEGLRAQAVQGVGNLTADLLTNATDPRGLGKIMSAGLVPAAALTAGLGGVALGAIPGALGVPGFQPSVVDPESYGSSNSPGARSKVPTMQYT